MTLAEFIAARLNEDQYLAGKFDWTGQAEWDAEMLARLWDRHPSDPILTHVARHDPARVLREVAAKRAILAEHRCEESLYEHEPTCMTCGVDDGWYNVPWPCPTMRHLAVVWSDHPDYQQEWKP